MYDVRFLNKDIGWACGGGFIIKTTDGGKNWVTYNLPYTILQVHPVNDSVVYACGFNVILKTTNSGDNWIRQWEGSNNDADFYGLWFINENTGWFCGDRVTMRTTDGGQTFIDSMFIDGQLNDVHFKNDSVGVAAAYSTMFRTTNAGNNWYNVSLPTTWESPFLERVCFVDDTGWTVSWGRTVFKSTNYGISWDSITNIPFANGQRAYCIEFSSSQVGFSGGNQGKIFKTSDGGYNWLLSTQTGISSITSIYSFSDSLVWSAGGGGRILHTTNGGGILVNMLHSSVDEIVFELYQNYPNPFNSTTLIKFNIHTNSFVRLQVYNIQGKVLKTLVNENLNSGEYFKTFDGSELNSGIYFYSLELTDKISNKYYSDAKKIVILK